jgi:acetylornithine deacetylase/succinyl-diaminopimelate desuccinylase-like protein
MPATNVGQLEKRIQSIARDIIDRRNNEINAKIDSQQVTARKNKYHVTVTNKNNLPAVVIPQGRDHALSRACISTLMNDGRKFEEIKIQACGPANESYMLMTKGIPTICGFGPIGGNPHGPDEWVQEKSLTETVQIYQQVVVEYAKLLNK